MPLKGSGKTAKKAAAAAMPKLPMSLHPNRAKILGLPDMAKPKRSTDEVQREKLAKEDQKREAEEKRCQGIVNAAAIENRITQEDEARDNNANHPLRPRQEKPATHLLNKPRLQLRRGTLSIRSRMARKQ
ncbi:hypothetical protein B0H10DRAFT_1955800 [Mycena sp. CBHHK59/15]|nr:hypothetical protein B0H10DRAFT_1955800 [Mycena sp. CBHHK59/15]